MNKNKMKYIKNIISCILIALIMMLVFVGCMESKKGTDYCIATNEAVIVSVYRNNDGQITTVSMSDQYQWGYSQYSATEGEIRLNGFDLKEGDHVIFESRCDETGKVPVKYRLIKEVSA